MNKLPDGSIGPHDRQGRAVHLSLGGQKTDFGLSTESLNLGLRIHQAITRAINNLVSNRPSADAQEVYDAVLALLQEEDLLSRSNSLPGMIAALHNLGIPSGPLTQVAASFHAIREGDDHGVDTTTWVKALESNLYTIKESLYTLFRRELTKAGTQRENVNPARVDEMRGKFGHVVAETTITPVAPRRASEVRSVSPQRMQEPHTGVGDGGRLGQREYHPTRTGEQPILKRVDKESITSVEGLIALVGNAHRVTPSPALAEEAKILLRRTMQRSRERNQTDVQHLLGALNARLGAFASSSESPWYFLWSVRTSLSRGEDLNI